MTDATLTPEVYGDFGLYLSPASIKNRLRIMRSDLSDCTNPKVLAKYPHLGNPAIAEQLRAAIKKLEGMQ
jgi:hypothetical protein